MTWPAVVEKVGDERSIPQQCTVFRRVKIGPRNTHTHGAGINESLKMTRYCAVFNYLREQRLENGSRSPPLTEGEGGAANGRLESGLRLRKGGRAAMTTAPTAACHAHAPPQNGRTQSQKSTRNRFPGDGEIVRSPLSRRPSSSARAVPQRGSIVSGSPS